MKGRMDSEHDELLLSILNLSRDENGYVLSSGRRSRLEIVVAALLLTRLVELSIALL